MGCDWKRSGSLASLRMTSKVLAMILVRLGGVAMEIRIDRVPVQVDVGRPFARSVSGIAPSLGVDGCGANF
jgi:hypothetical protein